MESNQLAIQIRDLRVSYTGTEDILNIKEWTIPSRTKHFLYGASGSGKSTLLSVLSGILSPSSGEVFIGGTQLNKLKSSERDRFRGENIGYIFQQFNLIPYLSVWDNINLPMVWNKDRKKRLRYPSAKEEIRYLASSLMIEDILEKKSYQISVGQAQRVAVARALLGSPPLILADEPTSALDEDSKSEFLKLLFGLVEEEGSTLLFVSHDKSLIPQFDAATNLKDIQS
jgi:putative ABC transport system ATP-binding protein